MGRTKQSLRKNSGGKNPNGSKLERLSHLSANKQNNEPDTPENCYFEIISSQFPEKKRIEMVSTY